jgi:hypothetical protein
VRSDFRQRTGVVAVSLEDFGSLGQKGQDKVVPKAVKEVCKAYGLQMAEVKGYVVTPDYVRVTMADGQTYRQGRLPGIEPALNLREKGGESHD